MGPAAVSNLWSGVAGIGPYREIKVARSTVAAAPAGWAWPPRRMSAYTCGSCFCRIKNGGLRSILVAACFRLAGPFSGRPDRGSGRVGTEKPAVGGAVPPLVVRTRGSDRTLPAGSSYLVGRDPECDIALTDARVSWHHAVLQTEDRRWVLADNGSTNGTFAGDRRVDRIEIDRECLVRLGHPVDGPVLSCTVSDIGPDTAGPHPRV